MEQRKIKKDIASVTDLKINLRLDPTADVFDADLSAKLFAAVSATGSFIGRDLMQVDAFSFRYSGSREAVKVDPAMHIVSVSVGGVRLAEDAWYFNDGDLVFVRPQQADDIVEVETDYNPDIKAAVLMQASYLWRNPADAVETLPKISQNLLKQYRYARQR